MEIRSRRQVLASAVGVLGVGLLPLPVDLMARAPDPSALQAQAAALEARALTVPPVAVLASAGSLLQAIEDECRHAGEARLEWARRALHSTAGVVALVAAQAALWSRGAGAWTTIAEDHARAAGDGILMARVRRQRARELKAEGGEVDTPTPAAHALLVAAQHEAYPKAPRRLRADILYAIAWEAAAEGDERGALVNLDAADIEMRLAGGDPADPAGSWQASRRAAALRRLGRHADAEREIPAALTGPTIRTTAVLCDLARLRAATGEVDAAAAALEDAFLLNRSAGLAGRQRYVRAARQVLPGCCAVRQLDDVMRGA
jgi:hypothetical protein